MTLEARCSNAAPVNASAKKSQLIECNVCQATAVPKRTGLRITGRNCALLNRSRELRAKPPDLQARVLQWQPQHLQSALTPAALLQPSDIPRSVQNSVPAS